MKEQLTYHAPLKDFQEGQWWINELDDLKNVEGAKPDQKRAVAVVHHLLRAVTAEADKDAEIAALKTKAEASENLFAEYRRAFIHKDAEMAALKAEVQAERTRRWEGNRISSKEHAAEIAALRQAGHGRLS